MKNHEFKSNRFFRNFSVLAMFWRPLRILRFQDTVFLYSDSFVTDSGRLQTFSKQTVRIFAVAPQISDFQ